MTGALVAIAFLGIGVASMVPLVRAIERARGDREHYRLAIRFWRRVAGVGAGVAAIFAYGVLASQSVHAGVLVLTFVLMSLAPLAVVTVGGRNAHVLAKTARKQAALEGGRPSRAVVRALRAAPWCHDLMVVEAEVPVPAKEGTTHGYRGRPSIPGRLVVRQVVPSELVRGVRPDGPVEARVAEDGRDAVLLLQPAVRPAES